MTNIACNTDGIINWKNDYAFEIDITLPLRKAGIDSIIGYGDDLAIWFMNETGLTIKLPDNLDDLLVQLIISSLARILDYNIARVNIKYFSVNSIV